MAIIFSKSCANDILGTGLVSCESLFGTFNKMILVKKGWNLDIETDTLDDAKVKELIQNQDWIVLRNHVGLESQDKETTYTESQLGADRYVRGRIYGFRLEYEDSLCYSAALKSISGQKWDVLFVDVEGNIEGRLDGTKFSGFATTLVRHDGITINDGANPANIYLKVQLTLSASNDMESKRAIPATDINFNDLNGSIGLKAVSTPSVITASPFDVKFYESCNEATPVLGLETLIKAFQLDGTEIPVTATVNGDGYTVDLGAYTGAGVLKLYDSVADSNIVCIGDQSYKLNNTINFTL